MKEWFLSLFAEDLFGVEIDLFSVYHILYFLFILGATLGAAFYLRKKSSECNLRVIRWLAGLSLFLYLADFFVMPLYLGEMEVDKLPFHICTAAVILAAAVTFVPSCYRFRTPVTVLALVGPLMYLVYPGSALGGVSPFSYRVVETFLFHGMLFAFGVLSLTSGLVRLELKKIWQEAVLLCIIAAWASWGNWLYSTEEHHYDWFFLTGSTFPFVPKFLMPFVAIAAVLLVMLAIYGIYYAVLAYCARRKKS